MKNFSNIYEGVLGDIDTSIDQSDAAVKALDLKSKLNIAGDARDRLCRIKTNFLSNAYKDCMGQKLNVGDFVIACYTINSWSGIDGFKVGVIVELLEDERGYTMVKCGEDSKYLENNSSYRFVDYCNSVLKITQAQAKKLYK